MRQDLNHLSVIVKLNFKRLSIAEATRSMDYEFAKE